MGFCRTVVGTIAAPNLACRVISPVATLALPITCTMAVAGAALAAAASRSMPTLPDGPAPAHRVVSVALGATGGPWTGQLHLSSVAVGGAAAPRAHQQAGKAALAGHPGRLRPALGELHRRYGRCRHGQSSLGSTLPWRPRPTRVPPFVTPRPECSSRLAIFTTPPERSRSGLATPQKYHGTGAYGQPEPARPPWAVPHRPSFPIARALVPGFSPKLSPRFFRLGPIRG